MHIKSLQIENFLKLRSLIIDPLAQVNLVAGFNETGKTSLAEAIGFALRGLPERVDYKKDYGQLVNDAGDEARIIIDRDSEPVTVSIKKKTATLKGAPNPDNVSQYMHAGLDMYYFTSLSAAERRKMLFRLGGVSASIDEIMGLLKTAGCNMDKAEQIKSLLRSGFDTAAAEAKEKAGEGARDWKRLTGEQWGSEKAKTWQAPIPELPEGGGDLISAAEDLLARRDAQQQKANELRTQLNTLKEYQAKLQVDNPNGLTPGDYQDEIETLENEEAELQADVQKSQALLSQAQGEKPTTYPCPDCGAELVFNVDSLEPYEEPEFDQDQVQQWQEDIEIASQRLRQIESDKAIALDKKTELETAERASKALGDMANQADLEQQLQETEQLVEQLTAQYNEAANQAEDVKNAQAAQQKAKETTEGARKLHEDIMEWTAIREQLDPDGIPKQLMAKALGPINVCLAELADVVGWRHPAIDADMAITYGDRSFALCSESAKWRCCCLLSAAIVYLSGFNFLLLDRVDVLDLPSRGQLVGKLTPYLAEKGVQIIMCATLKEPVNIEGVNCVWLQQDQQASAA